MASPIPGLDFNTPTSAQSAQLRFGTSNQLPALNYNQALNSGGLTLNYAGPQKVLGASSSTSVSQPQSSGGGAGGGGGSAPTSAAPAMDPIQQAINDQFNSSMNYLGGLEGSLRQNQPGIEGEINSNYNTSVGNLDRSQQSATGQIDQSQQAGDQRHLDALTAARNLYNELITGGHQKFGGASSAGEAFQALSGRELQRNNQQIGTDYSQFSGQIAQAKNNLQMQYQNSLATLEQQRNSALSQAQRDFQDKLNQINAMRDQAGQAKATARINAITDLRNQIYQINVSTAQNSQAVQSYAKQISDQLAQYEQQAGQSTGAAASGVNTFSQQASTNPQTSLSMASTGQGGVPQQYTGMIDPNNKDLIGSFNNPFDKRQQ